MHLNRAMESLKISLLGSALCSPASGQEQSPLSEQDFRQAAISAPPDPQMDEISPLDDQAVPPVEQPPVQGLSFDSDALNLRNFEPQAAVLRASSALGEMTYIRLTVLETPEDGDLLRNGAFLVIGPIATQEQFKAAEDLLTDRGFAMQERTPQNFLSNQLELKPTVPSASPYKKPFGSVQTILEEAARSGGIFFLAVLGGVSLGLILSLRSRMGRNGSVAEIRTFDNAPEQSLDDVGGCEHIVAEMRELTAEIRAAREGTLKASELPRGIIFEGAPGAGKTLLARAIAGEVQCPFLYVNSASCTASHWMGDATAAVLDIFKRARAARDSDAAQLRKEHGKKAPHQGVVIVFLDEFDTIGTARSSMSGAESYGSHELNHMVNALLAEMDGIDSGLNQGVIVLAATNMAHSLDTALTRPGRFSRVLHVPTPTSEVQRVDILKRLAKKLVTDAGYSFADEDPFGMLGKITVGDTGDYLRGVLSEAVSIARREGTRIITQAHLMEGYQRQKFGRTHESHLSEERHRLVACHEHGHAIVAMACGIDPFLVSMQARGDTGGRVVLDPIATYQPPMSVRDMMRMIVVNLGGRAAELQYFGGTGITDGAASDIDKCRKLIRHGVTFGMLDGIYSEEVADSDVPLTPRVKEVIDQQVANGLKVAQEILDIVGEDIMTLLVNDSIELGKELVGAEAREFYRSRIPEEVMLRIRARAQEYLGEKGTTYP